MSEQLDGQNYRARILIVDDEEFNRQLIKGILRSNNYLLFEAENGLRALELIEKEPPDVILLDIMMPEMDGFEVCKRLKESRRWKSIPVLMVTSLNEVSDYVKAIEYGADDFITKPVDGTALQARVRGFVRVKALADRLAQANRLKSELTRMIVHDLRGPITGIMGYIDLALVDSELSPSVRSYLEMAMLSTSDATQLIDNLLNVEKMESGSLKLKIEPVDVAAIIRHVADVMNSQIIRRGLRLVTEGPQYFKCYCDSEMTARIAQNLLVNSIKFAPEDSEIFIKWGMKDNMYHFSLANHGDTIPEEFQQKIFEKFVQIEGYTVSSSMGVGLGLAFCKMAVDAHSGFIKVVSPVPEFGDGVRLEIFLPQTITSNKEVVPAISTR